MNYLRISNKGLICPEDLSLIGSSTKRDQTGKIGMFGSGWKYALAWMLRNGCEPKIFAGQDLIEIDFSIKMHRDNPVKIITVNGQETSLTTEMGPKWTGWMAIREVLSNAIDEGGHNIITSWSPEFKGADDETVIFIPMNGELSEVMMKYDMYFSFNRKENYNTEHGRIFLKKEPSQINIYRKGIRCHDTTQLSNIDFDFNEININEDRLCGVYDICYKVRDIIEDITDSNLLKIILKEGEEDWQPYHINSNVMEKLKELINSGETFTTTTLIKLGGIMFSDPNSLIIRPEWYKKLQDLGLVKSPFDMFDSNETFIRTDVKDTSGIKYYLDNFGIKIEVRSGKCDSEALFKNGIAYIKDDSKSSDLDLAAAILGKMKKTDFISYLK